MSAAGHELWSSYLSQTTPVVFTAPSEFKFGGYQGNMNTWEAFGKWISQLNSGRRVLPEKTKAEVQRLVQRLTDEEQVVKKVYEYMQSRTRYVSIQLGIGGYQPFDAATVDKLGYGDCKALSNYTQALLEAVGIKSYYTLVNAGRYAAELHTDFPSTQFNHAILCVPLEQDTIWLECTSQTNPFGYLGYHTSDRNVLVIDEKGGHLERTPKYDYFNNIQSRKASVTLNFKGNSNVEVITHYTGLQYEQVEETTYQSAMEQKKFIYAKTKISSFDLLDYNYEAIKAKVPVVKEVLKMKLENFANASGSRLILAPNLLNKLEQIPSGTGNRESDIMIRYAYQDVDTITYLLPDELYTEYVPEPVSIKTKFGEYKTDYVLEVGKITYIRNFTVPPGIFPPDAYEELVRFYKHVAKEDNMKVVLKKAT